MRWTGQIWVHQRDSESALQLSTNPTKQTQLTSIQNVSVVLQKLSPSLVSLHQIPATLQHLKPAPNSLHLSDFATYF